ncbi:MAG: thioredoxin [Anaerolineaceae bacterium]|nr:thioredoxin [Anaerolineaceae bacterium]
MSSLTPVSQSDFEAKVLKAVRPVLVEFGAPWCGPCKIMEPVLVEMSADFAGRVDFLTVDVDQSPELAMQYGVMGVPTVILFRDGQPLQRMTGYKPRKVLEAQLLSKLS